MFCLGNILVLYVVFFRLEWQKVSFFFFLICFSGKFVRFLVRLSPSFRRSSFSVLFSFKHLRYPEKNILWSKEVFVKKSLLDNYCKVRVVFFGLCGFCCYFFLLCFSK